MRPQSGIGERCTYWCKQRGRVRSFCCLTHQLEKMIELERIAIHLHMFLKKEPFPGNTFHLLQVAHKGLVLHSLIVPGSREKSFSCKLRISSLGRSTLWDAALQSFLCAILIVDTALGQGAKGHLHGTAPTGNWHMWHVRRRQLW